MHFNHMAEFSKKKDFEFLTQKVDLKKKVNFQQER